MCEDKLYQALDAFTTINYQCLTTSVAVVSVVR